MYKRQDKLIGINGKELTYDEIGNLTSYDGTTYSWNMGRQLAGVENGKSIQYAYDHTGMRVKKTVDGVTTTYHMAGTLITVSYTHLFQEKGKWKEIDNTLEEEIGFAATDTERNADGAEERGWKLSLIHI